MRDKHLPGGGSGKRILIVAGGTGGHIFPAAVLGRWLEERGFSVAYLSGSRPVEGDIYAALSLSPRRLPLEGSPLGVRSPVKILRRSLALFSALLETSRCLGEVRPDVVFLFGGYISLMPLLLCRLRGIRTVVHEQNAVAGKVTRLAARLGCVITAGWQECARLPGPFQTVGIPVREPRRLPRAEALGRLGLSLPEGARVVGVAGGSLGSRPLNEALMRAAGETGDVEFVMLGEPLEGASGNVHFVGRQWDMNPFYSLCDVLVCRAGGSTLAEALRWGLPTVTVPWEGAAEGHQAQNARCFAALGGGVVWREGDPTPLSGAIGGLMGERPGVPVRDSCLALARAAGLSIP